MHKAHPATNLTVQRSHSGAHFGPRARRAFPMPSSSIRPAPSQASMTAFPAPRSPSDTLAVLLPVSKRCVAPRGFAQRKRAGTGPAERHLRTARLDKSAPFARQFSRRSPHPEHTARLPPDRPQTPWLLTPPGPALTYRAAAPAAPPQPCPAAALLSVRRSQWERDLRGIATSQRERRGPPPAVGGGGAR